MNIQGYADALLAVANAEGDLDTTKAQLLDVARAVEGNEELRSSLSNNLLPAAIRGQIVSDLLANKATNTVQALVAMLVTAGKGAQLGDIVNAFAASAATAGGKNLAVVRTAVPLSASQRTKLAEALASTAGGEVEIQEEIDPSVVGGVVTTIGDTVIDGSLRTRLNQIREAL
jgi:F-type H+-transporting ATPase subunit delta